MKNLKLGLLFVGFTFLFTGCPDADLRMYPLFSAYNYINQAEQDIYEDWDAYYFEKFQASLDKNALRKCDLNCFKSLKNRVTFFKGQRLTLLNGQKDFTLMWDMSPTRKVLEDNHSMKTHHMVTVYSQLNGQRINLLTVHVNCDFKIWAKRDLEREVNIEGFSHPSSFTTAFKLRNEDIFMLDLKTGQTVNFPRLNDIEAYQNGTELDQNKVKLARIIYTHEAYLSPKDCKIVDFGDPWGGLNY